MNLSTPVSLTIVQYLYYSYVMPWCSLINQLYLPDQTIDIGSRGPISNARHVYYHRWYLRALIGVVSGHDQTSM
jgi:hypothetical protein